MCRVFDQHEFDSQHGCVVMVWKYDIVSTSKLDTGGLHSFLVMILLRCRSGQAPLLMRKRPWES